MTLMNRIQTNANNVLLKSKEKKRILGAFNTNDMKDNVPNV